MCESRDLLASSSRDSTDPPTYLPCVLVLQDRKVWMAATAVEVWNETEGEEGAAET